MEKWIWSLALCYLWTSHTVAGERKDNQKGNQFYKQGDYDQALKAYSNADEKAQSKNPIIKYNKGNAHYQLNRMENAIEEYEQSNMLNPKDPDLHFNLGKHAGRLLATHYRNPRVRPHPEESRLVGPSAHPVVSGAKRTADDDRKFRNFCVRDGSDELRTIFRDAALFELLSDHEAGDVLEEEQWNFSLITELDKMSAF